MPSNESISATNLDLFAKTFCPSRKKFTLREIELLADILSNASKKVHFGKVHELATVFFPQKTELDEKEARVLSNFLLCVGLNKSQENRLVTLFRGQNHCTINELIDVINAVSPDPSSKLYRPNMGTDGNGNLISSYLFECRDDSRIALGREGIVRTLREYNG